MQTFLPYEDFNKSFSVLDYRRLGKQRVEGMQIVNTLEKGSRWANHPAVKMWRGYELALKQYVNMCIIHWLSRGYKNNIPTYNIDESKIIYPWWLGNQDFHRAMRARLIEKNREYYIDKFPGDEDFNNCKYLWPVNETKTFRII